MVNNNIATIDSATNQQKVLTVYKASAGSGKTFTLATEYMKLVIENPYAYRSILAVTFTNKATEEMKMRILSQLYGISKGLPDSDSYLQHIKATSSLSEAQIRERAEKALGLLLHHYHYFRIETIDAFFQRVLRNLARELDLTANLRLELNDKQIQEKAVDELIDALQPNNELLRWILEYVEQNISDDKSWNVIGQIKSFGANIFKDVYKEHHDELEKVLNRKDFFSKYSNQLRDIKNNAAKEFEGIAEAFHAILHKYEASVDDLSRRDRGPAGYFIKIGRGVYDDKKLVNSYVKKAMDAPENWLTKEKQNDHRLMLMAAELTELLNASDEKRKKLIKPYRTAILTLRHLNQLRLLGSIEKKVRELNNTANSFLLSDTQTLLNNLIEDSDSPFIFEKIGTQLQHVMIDEFQDTSTIQWKNFKILLQETISHQEGSSLIVGDVKQSIYRWRSGDWRLLNNIEGEFPHRQHLLEVKHLDTNYRSERNIVEFNNTFFTIAARKEYEALPKDHLEEARQMQLAYQDVCQEVPANKEKKGFVNIKLFPKDTYDECMMQEVAHTIAMLVEQGVKQKQIAILVRNNKEIQQIANMLMQDMPHISLVSDEAFRLDASVAVNILVDAMHCLIHPEDHLTLANLSKTYQKQIVGNTVNENDLFVKEKNIADWLPKEYTQESDMLLALPTIDLVERLYVIFNLQSLKEQSAYICAFYDLLSQHLADHIADMQSFINRWNDTLYKKTIQADGIDGVRMLTIHKSKGLEYDHVIIPFCNWQLEQRDTLWCNTDVSPFCELPLIPIDFSETQMKETFFEGHYQYEHLQNVVDNLNLLYVAFTRAGKNLFIFGQRKVNGRRTKIIEESLEEMQKALSGSILTGALDDESDTLNFEYGTLLVSNTISKEASQNVFYRPIDTKYIEIESFENAVQFRQSNLSREFVQQDDDDERQQQSYIRIGNILHQLFSKIATVADIDTVLQQFQFDGVLYDDVVTPEKLQELMNSRLKHPKVSDWFSDRWQLFNECSILHVDALTQEVVTHRPDRVMTDGNEMIVVDFKFGAPKSQYHDQMKQYIALLNDMGYQNITGYLWFVYTNKIEEVK